MIFPFMNPKTCFHISLSSLVSVHAQKLFWDMGFGVWGLGFGVWGLGFGVWACTDTSEDSDM